MDVQDEARIRQPLRAGHRQHVDHRTATRPGLRRCRTAVHPELADLGARYAQRLDHVHEGGRVVDRYRQLARATASGQQEAQRLGHPYPRRRPGNVGVHGPKVCRLGDGRRLRDYFTPPPG